MCDIVLYVVCNLIWFAFYPCSSKPSQYSEAKNVARGNLPISMQEQTVRESICQELCISWFTVCNSLWNATWWTVSLRDTAYMWEECITHWRQGARDINSKSQNPVLTLCYKRMIKTRKYCIWSRFALYILKEVDKVMVLKKSPVELDKEHWPCF